MTDVLIIGGGASGMMAAVYAARSGARVLVGDLTGISATVLDRNTEAMQQIRTLEVTFRYEPRK